jgi:hypothetical protein
MLSLFSTVDLDVAVNKKQKLNVVMETRQYFPFFTVATLQNISLLREKI